MDTDERFKHLASDPRFKTLRKKQRKVQIDERFQSMFTDERFTLKYSKDKRGRDQKKTSGDDLKRYYSLEENKTKTKLDDEAQQESDTESEDTPNDKNEIEDADSEEAGSEEDDDEENSQDFTDEDDVQSESELSTSSDEPESDIDGSESEVGVDVDITKLNYDWQPLDADAEQTDTITSRLAIQNLDWDHLDVKDIYILVNSIRPPMSVKIFVSEFGKERLAKEEAEGPQELIERSQEDEEEEEFKQLESKMKALQEQNTMNRKLRNNEYEDADDAIDLKNEEVREKIRRYQLNRMKYYYAIAEFDSAESAEAVYKELDGMEYEGSSLELDLRFVPDDMEFDSADLKFECNKLPDPTSYKAPQFINSALQQTTVKFTWDETDVKRQEKLQRAFTKEELEKDDLEAYLASETEESDEIDDDDDEGADQSDTVSVVTANSEARINKYKMLLKSLEEEEESKKKVDVDVEWGNFDEDEKTRGKMQADESSDNENSDFDEDDMYDDNEDDENGEPESLDDSEDESSLGKKKDVRINKANKKAKNKKRLKGKDGDSKQSNVDANDDLHLLVMDGNEDQLKEFEFNPDDDRFNAVYESGLYNIDPSHPNFKRTKAFDQMAEKKREKRRRT